MDKILRSDLTETQVAKLHSKVTELMLIMETEQLQKLFKFGTGIIGHNKYITYYINEDYKMPIIYDEVVNDIAEYLNIDSKEHELDEIVKEEMLSVFLDSYKDGGGWFDKEDVNVIRVSNKQMLKDGRYALRINTTTSFNIYIEWGW